MARQKEDKETLDLLVSANAKRQAKFKDEQKKKGLKQVNLWMTSDQEVAIRKYLKGGNS